MPLPIAIASKLMPSIPIPLFSILSFGLDFSCWGSGFNLSIEETKSSEGRSDE
jgi:hypothetical protein